MTTLTQTLPQSLVQHPLVKSRRRRASAALCALALATLVAGPAQALSCLAPDVARSFDEASTSDARYMVLHGTLDRGTPSLPEQDLTNPDPEVQRLPALVRGKALTEDGFSAAVQAQITMELGCTGPWCAALPENGEVLAFIELTNNGPILRLNACGGHLFADPSPEQIALIESCQADGCPAGEEAEEEGQPASPAESAPEADIEPQVLPETK
ncbi:hypothetical protein DL237_16360 [Pseudooceanicola sediminis]|uniref:Uncharacterized protein n=1 Tax=Pseudooceanicola sediminis TaxID=2211117 RepID=A0A399IXF3_9RHOB|nr:hypothetical protein [Pseudooceanicola sediminis]KAA2312899.1 hypothetical protein E0K93_15505 [Puniceibacterium sp. HSS470]RII37701.1 hypothetical protein DL237_16360 [Pseudooceanicola sediminis]|tara:strand:- start:52627 stop:53265 length:639 start_codon:yes stop_codon:yes gene_type:complete